MLRYGADGDLGADSGARGGIFTELWWNFADRGCFSRH